MTVWADKSQIHGNSIGADLKLQVLFIYLFVFVAPKMEAQASAHARQTLCIPARFWHRLFFGGVLVIKPRSCRVLSMSFTTELHPHSPEIQPRVQNTQGSRL